MKVTAQLYGQFLVSSQVNYTGTYLADHLEGLTHDNVRYLLKTSHCKLPFKVSQSKLEVKQLVETRWGLRS